MTYIFTLSWLSLTRKKRMKNVLVFEVLCFTILFRLAHSEGLQVAVANKSLLREAGFGYAYFVRHKNSKLEVENPRQYHAPTYKPCAVACTKNITCLSFNFGRKPIFSHQGHPQFLCELLSTDKYNSSSKYQSQNPDFDHYSIKSNCSKFPCLHNFTCIANYTEDTYECFCPRPAFQGKHCRDADECAAGQHDCSRNATCTNTIGSYKCTCNDGYFGNGKTCNDIPTCITEQALGMESRAIPDSALSSSSSWGNTIDYGSTARLNNDYYHWAPSVNRVGEWLQVDFSNLTLVTKVATQGRPYLRASYMTSYSLSYRRENESWRNYNHASLGGTLPGNTNYNGTVTNTLDPKITTRYMRIYPKTWYYAITIRVEFYGCYLS